MREVTWEHLMLKLWTRPKKTEAKTSEVLLRETNLSAKPLHETFLERARRNDTDGKQRRLRQAAEQNRLL